MLAKELGAKGRWHNDRMKEAHEAASGQLFAQRNAETLGAGGRGLGGAAAGVTTVDLHGLHVSEAIGLVDALVEEARQRRERRLRLVVGRGQHTRGAPAARLPAAVRQRLEQLGLAVREPYAGLLEVML